jgi:uncharacterized protein YcbX
LKLLLGIEVIMGDRSGASSEFQSVSGLNCDVRAGITLGRIAIYPLKSFDPILVDAAHVLANGALEHDRRFALVDSAGRFVNAKRTALIHTLQVQLDPTTRTLTARRRSDETLFEWQIDSQRPSVERWFSECLSTDVTLVEDDAGGFPDDGEAAGPTVVSTRTLQTVAAWFPGLNLDLVRLRFRANLETSAAEPFWEDRLFGDSPNSARPFRIGDVILAGTNPCQRCVVPSRDPATGMIWPGFSKHFSDLREAQLPAWAPRGRFDHFHRLTVNTRLLDRGSGLIRIADPLELIEP